MNCNNDKNFGCLNNVDNNNLNEVRFNDNSNINMNYRIVNGRFPENVMYGYAYVLRQRMGQIFRPEEGLNRGTIFPELVSNYEPCDSMEEIMYLRGGNRNAQ